MNTSLSHISEVFTSLKYMYSPPVLGGGGAGCSGVLAGFGLEAPPMATGGGISSSFTALPALADLNKPCNDWKQRERISNITSCLHFWDIFKILVMEPNGLLDKSK